jgi:hypothetical protein
MKHGCLTSAAVFGIASAASYVLLRGQYPAPLDLYGALGTGVGFTFACNLLQTSLLRFGEAQSIRAAHRGDRPKDGAVAAIVGTAHPSTEPLISPLFRRRCIAYEYEVYKDAGNSDSPTILFRGIALCPSVIRSPVQQLRLLGFPVLEELSFKEGGARELQNAAEYASSAPFEDFSRGVVMKSIGAVKGMLTLDSGEIRQDWKMYPVDEELLQGAQCRERVIEAGMQVTALGIYQEQNGGIAPDWRQGILMSLYEGKGESAIAARRVAVAGHAFAALALIALTVWLVPASLKQGAWQPKHRPAQQADGHAVNTANTSR